MAKINESNVLNDYDDLPDNHMPFTSRFNEKGLVGSFEHFPGFTISMDLPDSMISNGFNYEQLVNHIKKKGTVGEVTYPNGRKTEILYEIVEHKKDLEQIYMRSSLGYFVWERVSIFDDGLVFVINWWYCPPVTIDDIKILDLALKLLKIKEKWHQQDDRICEKDIQLNHWSLFCALKHASIEVTGEYNHHNTAIQNVRFEIDRILPDHGFEHTLMDYNNLQTTSHQDILTLLERSKKLLENELAGKN